MRRGSSSGHPLPMCVIPIECMERRVLMSVVGPDGFGYRAEPHPLQVIDLVAGAPNVFTLDDLSDEDDFFQSIDLTGRAFTFYGQTYTGPDQLWVSTNGLITFTGANGGPNREFENDDLGASARQAAVSPLWDDWYNRNSDLSKVLYQFAGNRLIVEWNMVQHFPGSPSDVTFQAVLDLNTGVDAGGITFNYPDIDTEDEFSDGVSATIGIKGESPEGENRLLVSFNATHPMVHTGSAMRIGINRQPILEPIGPFDVPEGSSQAFTATATDPEGDPLLYSWDLDSDGLYETEGQNVTFSAQGMDGPSEMLVAVQADDGRNNAAFTYATVNILNAAPTAAHDTFAGDEDYPISGNVLDNFAGRDSDPGVDTLTAVVAQGPTSGTLAFNADGSFVYTPALNFNGVDRFNYRAVDSDGAESAVATVTLNVAPVNDVPEAADDAVAGNQDVVLTARVLLNDVDVDGDALTAALLSPARFGTVALAADGTFRYVPHPGFAGSDQFTYAAGDGNGASDVAMVRITVTAAAPGSIYLIPDATRPGALALVVNGSGGGDVIAITPAGAGVEVWFGCETRGTWQPTGRILVFARAGFDIVNVAGGVDHSAWVYGDDGNDLLNLGNGGGIAFGGAGNDAVMGGNGRDILVGGEGADLLVANPGDDILISAVTLFDDRFSRPAHQDAWAHLSAEWNSGRTFGERVNNLRNGSGPAGRLNGSYFLNDGTIDDDAAQDSIDLLVGSSGEDWYVYKFGEDRVIQLSRSEAQYDLGIR